MKRPSLLFLFFALLELQLAAFNTSPSVLDTLLVSVDNSTEVSCFGNQDGAISLSVQGDEPFSFLWNTGDTTQNLAGLPAGFYSVVVTDSSGFQASLDSIKVGGPSELSLSVLSLVAPTCNGLNGELEIEASGGTPDYSYLWGTGDTTTLVQDLPPGDYEVTATDGNGCTAVLSISLQPDFPLVSLFSDGDIICTHPIAILNGEGSSASSGTFTFQWSASNGGEFLTATDTLVTSANVAGTYILEVTDTLNGCSATASVDVTLDTIAPTADAGTDTLAACTNSELSLSGSGSSGTSLSYQWSAENGGNILSGDDTAAPLVNHAGSYILTVTNLDNGCAATDSVTVSGTNDPPVATVSGGELTCLATAVSLEATADTAGLIFNWAGPNGFSSDELNPSVNAAGLYVFTLTDTITTCSGQFEAEVLDLSAAPALTLTGGTISCAITTVQLTATTSSSNANYEWAGPNGFSSNEDQPVVGEPGAYSLILTDTITGCFAIETATVSADTVAPIADAGALVELTCAMPSTLLNGSGSSLGTEYTYIWTTTDGNIVMGGETLSPEIDAVGTYTLTVADTLNGCIATDEVIVTGNFPLPFVNAIGGSFDCFEGEIQLIGLFDTTDVTFEWTGPNGFVSTAQNPTVNVAGDYTLAVTDTLTSCTGFATATVTKLGTDPVLTVTASGIITCAITEVQLTVESNVNTIVWSWAGDNGFTSTAQNPVVTSGGWYSVLAIDTAFGCIALDSILVGMDTISPTVDAGPGLVFHCNLTSGLLNGTASQGTEFSYLWTTLNGNIVNGETTLSPTVDAAGTYTLTASNSINGCTASDLAIVTENDPVGVTATSSDATCFGTATGTATVVATGGDGNFQYAWTSGSTSATATGLIIGTYSVTATDGYGCSAETTVSIGQPDPLTVEAIGTGQSLFGVNDGTATALPTGGTAPYTYSWSNSGITPVITGLAPGVYTVTAMDANGCTAIASANVNEFNCVLNSSITGSNASCFGLDDGTATIILENEIQPVAFIWSNGDTLATAAGLTAGIYTVTVSDSTNCTNVQTILINEPTQISIHEIFHEDVLCPGDADGSVAVGVTGGAQPYQFAWSNGSNSALAHSLEAGQYELSVTDGDGCTAFYTANIIITDSEPPTLVLQDLILVLDSNGVVSLTAVQLDAGSTDNCGIASWSVEPDSFDCTQTGDQTVTVTAIDLNGNQSTGTATVTITDDQAPVLLCPADISASDCAAEIGFDLPQLVDNCAFDPTMLQQTAGLSPGLTFPLGVTTQTFVYTDPSGVTAECTFEIVVVEGFEANALSTNVSCAGNCDGTILLTLTGGLSPYTVNWSNGATSTFVSDLCAGSYTGTITDDGGCVSNIQVEITEPAPLELSVQDVVSPTCPDDLAGAAAVDVTGGTPSYSFEWSNGGQSASIANVPAGTYSVSATDANGCEKVLEVDVPALDDEMPVLVLQNIQLALGANGTATLAANGLDNGSTDNCGIVAWTLSQSSFDCGDLGANTVTATATDGNGNENSATATVTVIDNTSPTLTCPANILAGFCNSTVMFALPQVNDNCTVVPGNLIQTSGLPSGSTFPFGSTTQAFSYTDAAGNAGTCSFTVTLSSAADISADATDISCANTCDGSITLTVTGGLPPFTILWSDGQTGPVATGLCAGAINATVTGATGCFQSFSTTLVQPMPLSLAVDQITPDVNNTGVGAIKITVTGGTPPYSYAWTRNGQPFASTEDVSNLLAGQYTAAVTDANGCEIASQTIVVDNTSGTVEPAWAGGLTMLPNPATAWVQVGLESTLPADLEIRLTDATGKLVSIAIMEKGTQQKTIDTATLAPGVYMVQMRAASGTVTRRLVVAK
ncbi:MAG: HYR domain-containing protein [Lewinellaceae bacterium]|nr:HYR domain-containing protein [Saprospiraceae bacterium]MCB9337477.1 HYR domain-containing protein [Lewinellaceae bacterium]